MVFIDANSNMEEHNLKVFIICTHSVALHLGLIVCSDKRTTNLLKCREAVYRAVRSTGKE